MKSVLLVANQTAAGPALQQAVADVMARGPCRFTLLVPATQPSDHITWTEGTATGLAQHRITEALDVLRGSDADVEGRVGDSNPFRAICDAMEEESFDEIVISTFPPGISRWLKMDLEHRVKSRWEVPVRMVITHRVAVRAGG